MDSAWMDLSQSEQAVLRTEGPRCRPMDVTALPPQFADARYVSEPEAWAHEGFQSPLEAILSAKAASMNIDIAMSQDRSSHGTGRYACPD